MERNLPRWQIHQFYWENGLKDNRIWDLDVDSKNNYWLALDGKCVQKFDGETFTHYGLEDGITAGETNTAYVDELDNVWIGTFGAGVCNFDGKYWNSIDSRDGLLENTITSICGVEINTGLVAKMEFLVMFLNIKYLQYL